MKLRRNHSLACKAANCWSLPDQASERTNLYLKCGLSYAKQASRMSMPPIKVLYCLTMLGWSTCTFSVLYNFSVVPAGQALKKVLPGATALLPCHFTARMEISSMQTAFSSKSPLPFLQCQCWIDNQEACWGALFPMQSSANSLSAENQLTK